MPFAAWKLDAVRAATAAGGTGADIARRLHVSQATVSRMRIAADAAPSTGKGRPRGSLTDRQERTTGCERCALRGAHESLAASGWDRVADERDEHVGLFTGRTPLRLPKL